MDDERRDTDNEQGPRSGRVRIFGAEQAGRTGEVPAVPGGQLPAFDTDPPPVPDVDLASPFADPTPRAEAPVTGAAAPGSPATADPFADPPPAPGPAPAEDRWPEPDLPHWTEAPTGEVPAILSRDTGGAEGGADPWASLPGPTWREEGADWAANEETFEPSMLAHDDGRLGSLDDSGATDRQPWTFELPASEQTPAIRVDDFDTMAVPVVQPSSDPVRPVDDGAPSTVAGSTVFPENGWALDPEEGSSPEGPGTGEPEERGRRRSLGRSSLGRTGRRRGRAADEDLVRRDQLGDPGGGSGVADEERPLPEDRPVPEDPSLSTRPRGQEPPSGEPLISSRPVPRAPSGRRPPARPRPGVGLRPPEASEGTRSGRNLPVAIASGLVIGIIALVFFDLGTVTAMIIATVVITLAAVEAYAAFRKAGQHPATLLGLVATISLMVATYNKGQAALPLVLVLLVAFTMLWHLAGVERAAEPIKSIASTLLVFCWVGVFGSFAALLLNPTLFPNRHGIAFLLGAVIVAVAYDIAALTVGAWIGSHPLSKYSPNKTWEGLIGGAVAAILVAIVIVHFIHPWTVGKAAALGVVVAIVSPIGDLSESLIKRHLGLKDMGRILPGHGGLLDRIDGLLFVLPATYYLVRAFHLG